MVVAATSKFMMKNLFQMRIYNLIVQASLIVSYGRWERCGCQKIELKS